MSGAAAGVGSVDSGDRFSHPLRPLQGFRALQGISFCYRLDLRSSEEPGLVDRSVTLRGVDQICSEKGFASVDHFITELLPTAPRVCFLGDTGCSFGSILWSLFGHHSLQTMTNRSAPQQTK